MSTLKRIQKELKDITENPPYHCSAGILDENIYNWSASIIGPENSPYKGGIFKLLINFPEDYPFHPPKIRFVTKNISL